MQFQKSDNDKNANSLSLTQCDANFPSHLPPPVRCSLCFSLCRLGNLYWTSSVVIALNTVADVEDSDDMYQWWHQCNISSFLCSCKWCDGQIHSTTWQSTYVVGRVVCYIFNRSYIKLGRNGSTTYSLVLGCFFSLNEAKCTGSISYHVSIE